MSTTALRPTALPAAAIIDSCRRAVARLVAAWRHAAEAGRFDALDDATVRDLGMSRCEFDSYAAEARNEVERTRLRIAAPIDRWMSL